MHNLGIHEAIAHDHENLARSKSSPRPCHSSIRPTHVDTDVAAEMLLVGSPTLRKSHSQKGNYAGIRPVILPSRKLAWPLAEIEKLLDIDGETK